MKVIVFPFDNYVRCSKNDFGEISMDIITTPYCCCTIRMIVTRKCISIFILSQFDICAISICFS